MKLLKSTVLMTAVLGLTALASNALAGDDPAKGDTASALPECPVMTESIDLSISLTTDQGPVFFCCQGCVDKYKADPNKYGEKASKQRELLAPRPKVQVVCATCDKAANKKVSLEHEGNKVYFCCDDCSKKFQEKPAQYKALLANSYTYQVKCPIMGGDINPQSFTKLANGKKIYYCCQGCDKKLLAEPAKYLPNLHKQGYMISAEMLAGGGK